MNRQRPLGSSTPHTDRRAGYCNTSTAPHSKQSRSWEGTEAGGPLAGTSLPGGSTRWQGNTAAVVSRWDDTWQHLLISQRLKF